ncbi:endonuclease V [Candidatus Sumerlaeota bacterium]|nr:endonuclease V [Candidatus Sumerlaeota bacterium]
MKLKLKHRWDLLPGEAIRLQAELAGRVSRKSTLRWKDIKLVAGVDVSYSRQTGKSYAGVVVFDFARKEPVETFTASLPTTYPYIPGLLSFREAPAVIAALDKISLPIDVLVCEGQGIAHPRGIGLATHLGIIYDIPTIGCAKSILFGEPAGELPLRAGSYVNLLHPDQKKILGYIVRTKDACRPVVVSPGHKISLPLARRVILQFCGKYRLPEIIRQPHILSHSLYKADIPDFAK